jgi:hypothetical protein
VQVFSILKSRELHVATILSLYQERAVLCRQSTEIAMKSSTTGLGLQGIGDENNSNMGVLMRHGHLYCARNMVALHRVLELVKVRDAFERANVVILFASISFIASEIIFCMCIELVCYPDSCSSCALN